jgi:hypothetical protein
LAPRPPRTRCDFTDASKLLDEGQALVKGFRDEDIAGSDRLQQLLTIAYVDNFLGQVRLSQADNDEATRLFTDGLTVACRADDRISILISLYDLALASQAQGDLAGAAGHLKEGLAIAAEAGDETSAACYLEALATVADQQDNPQRAIRLLSAGRSQLEAGGSGWMRACVPPAPHDDAVLAARCASASATRHTRRPGPGAGPSKAGAPDSTHWSNDPLPSRVQLDPLGGHRAGGPLEAGSRPDLYGKRHGREHGQADQRHGEGGRVGRELHGDR